MPETDEPKRLSCVEVWGGNRFVSTSVALPGMDAWVYSMPADGAESIGGGDVHYVSSCATGGALTRILLADVCGHGQEASATAHRLRKMMRFHVNFHTQTRFVRALNREFTALSKSERFATAIAFTYDAPVNKLLVCNAGHPRPWIWRQRTRRWEPLEPAERNVNLPLGILDEDYMQFEASIEFGDVVLCFTDALLECRRGEQMLEEPGLLEILKSLDSTLPQRIIEDLMSALSAAGWVMNDDLTIMVFQPNGLRQRIPLRDRLRAPLHALKWIGQLATR